MFPDSPNHSGPSDHQSKEEYKRWKQQKDYKKEIARAESDHPVGSRVRFDAGAATADGFKGKLDRYKRLANKTFEGEVVGHEWSQRQLSDEFSHWPKIKLDNPIRTQKGLIEYVYSSFAYNRNQITRMFAFPYLVQSKLLTTTINDIYN